MNDKVSIIPITPGEIKETFQWSLTQHTNMSMEIRFLINCLEQYPLVPEIFYFFIIKMHNMYSTVFPKLDISRFAQRIFG